MKLERQDDVYLKIVDIHPNELNLIRVALSCLLELSKNTEIDQPYNQDKDDREKVLGEILNELSKFKGSQIAESLDETILKKVIEKYS